MKNSKLNKRLSRKDYLELLSVKDINKKVKEPIPTKEKESEYSLVLIIKSLNNVINNIPKNLISSNNSRQELNYSDIGNIRNYIYKNKKRKSIFKFSKRNEHNNK